MTSWSKAAMRMGITKIPTGKEEGTTMIGILMSRIGPPLLSRIGPPLLSRIGQPLQCKVSGKMEGTRTPPRVPEIEEMVRVKVEVVARAELLLDLQEEMWKTTRTR
jgi:hypothetical protein